MDENHRYARTFRDLINSWYPISDYTNVVDCREMFHDMTIYNEHRYMMEEFYDDPTYQEQCERDYQDYCDSIPSDLATSTFYDPEDFEPIY